MQVCRNFVLRETSGMTMKMVLSMSTYSGVEKSKIMQKLINKKGAKSKKQWYKPYLGEPLETATKKQKKGISITHSIRLKQHSHVLYDKITEIINTGELSQDILDKQVAITSVKVHRDMSTLNVTWDADRKDAQELEQLLHAHSGKLRSLLISYHVLGSIPHIVFVKDKSKADLSHLTQLLAEADYGPDYMPGVNQDDLDPEEIQNILVPELITSYPSPEEVSPSLSRQEESSNESNDTQHDYFVNLFKEDLSMSNSENSDKNQPFSSEEELPFRPDVYGLNRNEIVQKIQAKRKRWIPPGATEDQLPLTFSRNCEVVLTNHTFDPLAKVKARQQIAKQERKVKEKMLERSFSDSEEDYS